MHNICNRIYTFAHSKRHKLIMYSLQAHVCKRVYDTAQLQWLKYFWNHEKMFETGVVLANVCSTDGTSDMAFFLV